MTHWITRRLESARSQAGLTRKQVAKKMGVRRWRRVMHWEIGLRKMTLEEADLYAAALSLELRLGTAAGQYYHAPSMDDTQMVVASPASRVREPHDSPLAREALAQAARAELSRLSEKRAREVTEPRQLTSYRADVPDVRNDVIERVAREAEEGYAVERLRPRRHAGTTETTEETTGWFEVRR